MICLRCKKDKNKDEFDFDPAVNRLSTYCRPCVWEQRNELKYFCATCGERKHVDKFPNDIIESSIDGNCCMKCIARKKKNDREKKKRAKKVDRVCVTCGVRKPITKFKINAKTKDGLHPVCNACLEIRRTKNAR